MHDGSQVTNVSPLFQNRNVGSLGVETGDLRCHHIRSVIILFDSSQKCRNLDVIQKVETEGGTIVEIALQDLENLPYGQSSYH